eukprot:CAMPEP_0170175916 /NCGR_PEP_ID=MMETSP0040_2-20121228/8900_1 /TAXON_ID=641309 /ORGANISM="Lotharella oceanica, Strain CCMP622" /LENGTH=30 /DNA_ID= /DNA_START= /DNA_END= /DNA_ORIENTATION=
MTAQTKDGSSKRGKANAQPAGHRTPGAPVG